MSSTTAPYAPACHLQTKLPVPGDVDDEPLPLQPALDVGGQFDFVLNYQYSHVPSVRPTT